MPSQYQPIKRFLWGSVADVRSTCYCSNPFEFYTAIDKSEVHFPLSGIQHLRPMSW